MKSINCLFAENYKLFKYKYLQGELLRGFELPAILETEDLMHGHFFENFIKSWKISLVTYKNM